MKSTNKECWLNILRFREFGHQSLLVVPLPVGCFGGVPAPVKGHFDCSLDNILPIFVLYNDSKVVSIMQKCLGKI